MPARMLCAPQACAGQQQACARIGHGKQSHPTMHIDRLSMTVSVLYHFGILESELSRASVKFAGAVFAFAHAMQVWPLAFNGRRDHGFLRSERSGEWVENGEPLRFSHSRSIRTDVPERHPCLSLEEARLLTVIPLRQCL